MLLLFLPAVSGPGWIGQLPGAGPSGQNRELLRLESSADAMGSTYTIAAYGYDGERLEAALDAAFDEARRIDRLLSNYRATSELSEVNRLAAERPVKVSAELFQLLAACVDYSGKSEGAFDVTVGPLMKVWGFYRDSGRLPRKEEVTRALEKVGYRHMQLDPAARTVRFDRPGVELDPGGIGKGYAVDRMAETLKENGISSAMISAAGSTIYGLGTPNNERGWEVEIRDPKDPMKTVAKAYLKNQSMSTSGSYEKFFEAEGKIYSHIMDPRTGKPAKGMLAVSVIAPKSLDSEAWTKPIFILGRDWARRNAPREFRVFICEDQAEQPCAWLQ